MEKSSKQQRSSEESFESLRAPKSAKGETESPDRTPGHESEFMKIEKPGNGLSSGVSEIKEDSHEGTEVTPTPEPPTDTTPEEHPSKPSGPFSKSKDQPEPTETTT
jgi:hypothetical protein